MCASGWFPLYKLKWSLGLTLVCTCKKVKLQINYYFMVLRLGQVSVCASGEVDILKNRQQITVRLLKVSTKGKVSNNHEMQC